jgi:hypothetical protein
VGLGGVRSYEKLGGARWDIRASWAGWAMWTRRA